MNTVLFQQIKEQVLAEPKSLCMRFFCRFQKPTEKACGTVGCIGGWAMLLMGMKKPLKAYRDWANADGGSEVPMIDEDKVAAALLDIPKSEANLLFYFYSHIADESNPYSDLAEKLRHHREGTVAYAKVVCEALDRCLLRGKTGMFTND